MRRLATQPRRRRGIKNTETWPRIPGASRASSDARRESNSIRKERAKLGLKKRDSMAATSDATWFAAIQCADSRHGSNGSAVQGLAVMQVKEGGGGSIRPHAGAAVREYASSEHQRLQKLFERLERRRIGQVPVFRVTVIAPDRLRLNIKSVAISVDHGLAAGNSIAVSMKAPFIILEAIVDFLVRLHENVLQ